MSPDTDDRHSLHSARYGACGRAAEGVAIMNADFFAQFGRDMEPADWTPTRMPLDGVPRIRTFPVGDLMSFPLAPEWHVKPAGGTFLDALSVPTSYAITAGTLPAGLDFNGTTGEISRTPSAQSPLQPTIPKRASDPAVRFTQLTVTASSPRGSSAQIIRFAALGPESVS